MRIAILPTVILAAIGSAYLAKIWFPSLADWAIEQQRAFQTDIATGVYALQAGEAGALTLLISAAAAYGFVHAVGPSHGKFLVGGVGLGSDVSSSRLVSIGMAASLGQAVWAILLVYGGFWALETSAAVMTAVTDAFLAPASYLAIGAIGALFVWRGLSGLTRRKTLAKHHHHGSCGCPSHQLDREKVAQLQSFREVVALILSIAVRPCTGVIFLLVIAWQLDVLLAGTLAVMAMGLGTGLLVSLVAVSSIQLRGLVLTSSHHAGVATIAAPVLQLLAGGMIIWFSASILLAGGNLAISGALGP